MQVGRQTARGLGCQASGSGDHLPEGLKKTSWIKAKDPIRGGHGQQLDLPLYGALFPELSVIPKESYDGVIRAVKGIRDSYEQHYVEAIGLIDKDDRTEDDVSELAQDSILALDVYSVESLYYCSDAIDAVARRQAESLGCDPQAMLEGATRNALEAIRADEDLPERMSARRSERLVYNRFTTHLPDWREIKAAVNS